MGQNQSSDSQAGTTDLLRHIINRRWREAEERARLYPEEVNTWYQEKCIARSPTIHFCMEGATEQRSNAEGVMVRVLPVHIACEGNAPLSLVQTLVNVFPDAVKIPDHRNKWLPLHYCATASNENSERLNFILSEYSTGSQCSEALGRLPLHLACEYGACSSAISNLVEAHPDSVHARTKEGKLPIHCAAMNRCDIEAVEILVRAHPSSIHMKDFQDKSPIQYMNESHHPNKQALLTMMERTSAEVLRRSEGGSHSSQANINRTTSTTSRRPGREPIQITSVDRHNALHKLILSRSWESVLARISSHPLECAQMYTLKDSMGVTWAKSLPIHDACRLDPPFEVIKDLLRAFNSASVVEESGGSLPLHILCEHGSSTVNNIKLVLKVYRSGAFQRDRNGMLPLHCVAWGNNECVDLIELLFKINKGAVYARDKHGRTPLQLAIMKNNARILDLFHDQLQHQETTSTNALSPAPSMLSYTSQSHISVRSTRSTRTALFQALSEKKWNDVKSILHDSPGQANNWKIVQSSTDGTILSRLLPIHLACQINPPLDVIKDLLRASPDSAGTRGDANALPIHSACAHGASIEVIEILLRHFPNGVNEEDANGFLPLNYAMECTMYGHRDEVISMLKKDAEYWKQPNPQAPTTKSSPPEVATLKTRFEENQEHGSFSFKRDHRSTNSRLPSILRNVKHSSYRVGDNRNNFGGDGMGQVSKERATQIQKEKVKSNESIQKTDLYKIVEKRDWNALLQICKRRPEEASIWHIVLNNKGEVISKTLPIHELCKRKPEEKVLFSLISAYLDGVQKTDHNNRLPLHYACEFGASLAVINLLYNNFQGGISTKDCRGMLPIHCCCLGGSSVDVISRVVSLYREGLEEVDNFQRAPVTIVLEGSDPNKISVLEAIQTLQNSYSSAEDNSY